MSTPVTMRARRFTVFLGVEDKVHAGMPLIEHVGKKLMEHHGRESLMLKVHPLGGKNYAAMLAKAQSVAGSPGHDLKFVFMDSDRHRYDKVEKHPPEHYDNPNSFRVRAFDPAAECVVLRLKEPTPDDMRGGGCAARLGPCDSLEAFRATVGNVSLEQLAAVSPLGEVIDMIESALVLHLKQIEK